MMAKRELDLVPRVEAVRDEQKFFNIIRKAMRLSEISL